MNIFLLSEDPIEAANNLVDKHQNKMIVEGAQCLSSALRINGYQQDDVYKISYRNHPSIQSLVDNQDLFIWLWLHCSRLCVLYSTRTNKVHASQQIIERCSELLHLIPESNKTIYDLVPACSIFNDHPGTVIDKYRAFYLHDKSYMLDWTKNNMQPNWIAQISFDFDVAWYLHQKRNQRVKKPITREWLQQKCKQLGLL
jgi:hypothetical protein